MAKTKAKKNAVKKSATVSSPEINSNLAETIVDEKDLFTISVNICGQTVETKTDNISESILSFKPKMIKGKIIFTVTHNGKVAQKVFKPFEARRLFNNRLMADFFTKNIMLRLK